MNSLVKEVPVDWLHKYIVHPTLRNEEESDCFKQLLDSISKYGIIEPLVMVIGLYDGMAWLKNGHHRLRVAEKLGHEKVPIEFIVRADTGGRGKKLQ